MAYGRERQNRQFEVREKEEILRKRKIGREPIHELIAENL
jgi:hypothetical protein